MKYLKYFEKNHEERKKETKKRFIKNMNILTQNLDDIDESVVDFVIEHCSEWIKNPVKLKRSIAIKDEMIFYSKPVKRFSVHNENYYNLIIDNDLKWKDFPKRNKSFIASLYESPSFAGEPFYMIPFDGAKFGVGPRSDIFASFREGFRKMTDFSVMKFRFFGIDDFFISVRKYFKDNNIELKDTNYRNLKLNLNKIKDVDIVESDYFDYRIINKLRKLKGSFYSNLSKCMAPDINNFKIMNIEDLYDQYHDAPPGNGERNEIWTESSSVFITQRYIFELLEMIDKKLNTNTLEIL